MSDKSTYDGLVELNLVGQVTDKLLKELDDLGDQVGHDTEVGLVDGGDIGGLDGVVPENQLVPRCLSSEGGQGSLQVEVDQVVHVDGRVDVVVDAELGVDVVEDRHAGVHGGKDILDDFEVGTDDGAGLHASAAGDLTRITNKLKSKSVNRHTTTSLRLVTMLTTSTGPLPWTAPTPLVTPVTGETTAVTGARTPSRMGAGTGAAKAAPRMGRTVMRLKSIVAVAQGGQVRSGWGVKRV